MQCCVIILVVGISIDYVFIKNAAYTLKKGLKKLGPQISGLLITTAVMYRLLAITICKIIQIQAVVHEILGVKVCVQ